MRILRLFRHHVLALFAVTVLLVVSANADLALPTLMSEIVDVGIQQGGVKSPVPDTIRASSLDDLELFMSDEDVALVEAAFAPADDAGIRAFQGTDVQKDVIQGVSFTTRPGHMTGIIGSTGSGKSTLVQLIPRPYDVTGGAVLLDGVDVRDWSLSELRRRIGYVPQQGTLFSGTIEINLKFAGDAVTDDDMREAARVAQAEEFIEERPEGYDAPISQGSTNVSGGQRQRLAIARALAKRPEVVVFDDSFSALDYATDARLRAWDRAALRQEFAMVLQDTWLFNGTIRENIRYGRPDATDEELEAAARAARCDHFIHTLAGGYDFVINEEGTNLSQGQRQLVTIARAVLADRPALILDEATSNVDTRTEELIRRAMDELMRGRTSFVIAHRLSTIRNADVILVLRDGDVVEKGTHEELLAKDGFYAELYNSQFDHAA